MNGGTVTVHHLVELIDAADAAVGKHECSAFQHHFAGEGVLDDRSSETDTAGSTASGVLTASGQTIDVGQQLRLGHARIAHEDDVDGT